jgi:hypothetical protein
MANESFQHASGKGKFAYLGIDLRNPPDLMPPGRAPYLLNVTPDQQQGTLHARAGLSYVGGVTGLPHSIKRVNNSLPGSSGSQRFIGAGTSLFSGLYTFTQLDTGYSGNPLSMIPYRPPQSPETWLYVYDSAQSKKYRTDGVTKQAIGILPPRVGPSMSQTQPYSTNFTDALNPGAWGIVGAAAVPTSANRIATTITTILYDTGAVGWATIAPANGKNIGLGSRLQLNGTSGEYVNVFGVYGSLASTTILGVAYDSGTSGLGTIVPTVATQGLQRNQMVQVNGTAVRVTSVTEGPDGLYSFRATLPAGLVAGQAVVIPFSFRAYTTFTQAATNAVNSYALQSVMTLAAGVTSGTGLVYANESADLSQLAGRPLTGDDYIHAGFMIDNPANVQEVHVLFDVDPTTNDFAHNFYYKAVRQSDFQGASSGSSTTTLNNINALTNNIANNVVSAGDYSTAQLPYPAGSQTDFSGPSAEQFAVGNAQWFDLTFKINDLTRVGTDQSVGLSNVKAFGVLVLLSGTATFSFGSVWVGGSYGPDSNINSYGNQGQPILYRYRYRSSLSGAYSDVSPATRNGETPWRQGMNVTVTASTDPQVDLIDIERNGGTGDTWHRCLIVPNVTATYQDFTEETIVQASDPLELLSYAPWPVTDKPRTGTCNIVGTRVTRISGDAFNLNWIRGVEFIVNQQTYTLHAPPDSISTLSLSENVGVKTGVTFIIPEATIIGYSLPYACLGPDGRVFATGDPYNPGNLYFSNPYNPDSASDRGYIEITGPSDPLGPPTYYDGAIYVHSATDLYRVDSTPGSVNPYGYYKLGGTAGIAASWAVCGDGPMLAWLGRDGIYAYAGGSGGATNLTAPELYLLFPFESRPGLPVSVAGYILYPPDYSQLTKLRLSYADGFWYFDYVDTQGTSMTLAYNPATKGWVPYQYRPGVSLHYQEEGVSNPLTLALGLDSTIYNLSNATSDNGLTFTCVCVTPADDGGETRARKQYGDLMVDYNAQVAISVYYDNFLLTGTTAALTHVGRTQIPIDLGIDSATLHRNIGLVAVWSSTYGTELFEWQPSALLKPEDSLNRPTDWLDAGTMHYKFVHGCRITADTGGVTRTVQVQYDGGILGPVLSINHAGELALPYSFPPFKAHLMRLVPTDGLSWRLMGVEWEVDIEPEPTTYWVTQPTSFGMPGYLHIRDFQIAYASLSVAALSMIVDGVSYVLAALPATGGVEVKKYFPAPPVKGKLWQLYGTGSSLQIYQVDCEFRVKSWAGGQYSSLKPFGDLSVTSGGAKL